MGDRVLGDLGKNRLLGLEDVLDTGLLSASLLALASAVEIIGVVLDIAGIEHGVLGRGDVDKRLPCGQDVLDPSEVDVAVDLADVVGRARDLMLDQFASLEGCDLGGLGADMDTHEITADGLALAGATTPTLQRLFVKFDRVAGGGDGLDGWTATLPFAGHPGCSGSGHSGFGRRHLAATATTTAPRRRRPSWAGRHRPVLRAIAAVLAILVASIFAAIALWGGAGIADLGGRTAVADLRPDSVEDSLLAAPPPLWRLGVSFWACSSAMVFVFRRRRRGGDHATPTGADAAAATSWVVALAVVGVIHW